MESLALLAGTMYTAFFTTSSGLMLLPPSPFGLELLHVGVVLKALPALSLAMAALGTRVPPRFLPHARGMAGGLVLSAVGDVLLDLAGASPDPSSPYFLGGLGSFLLAHVIYARALLSTAGHHDAAVAVACVLMNGYVFLLLLPHILAHADGRALLGPVLAYMAALTAVLYASTVRSVEGAHSSASGARSWYATVSGAASFCVSDAMLAWSMFAPPPRTEDGAVRWWWVAPKVAVMVTYYTAQCLLTRGVTALGEGGGSKEKKT